MSRRTPPDHRDPKATAGLTARRRAAGLSVGVVDTPAIQPRQEGIEDLRGEGLIPEAA